jgi:uncharacterized membrane protein
MSDAPASGRVVAIDVARGVALIGMAVYHLSWDLAYFELAAPTLPYSRPMRIFSHVVASAFLGLAGVSLALAHRAGPDWRAYAKRLGVVGAAAALVSAATGFAAPEAPILFGILHCIFAASLLAAPLLSAPAWVALALGIAAVAAPRVFSSPVFDPAALLWLGLGTQEPATLDWRPLLPWGGATLLGLGLAKLAPPRFWASPPARWRPRLALPRALAFGGRHSLAIYLVHQPLLFALLYAATQWTGVAAERVAERYLAACRPACIEAGGTIEACERACACVVGKARGAGLTAALGSRGAAETARREMSGIVAACGDEAR